MTRTYAIELLKKVPIAETDDAKWLVDTGVSVLPSKSKCGNRRSHGFVSRRTRLADVGAG